MNAELLVQLHGQKLVGRQLLTEAVGTFPGGIRKVLAIMPDPEAPEIVMEVDWLDDPDGSGSIGIFACEEVKLIGR